MPLISAASRADAEPDPNTSNNTDSTNNGGSTNAADVSVVKTLLTSGPFVAGQTISYSLVVANGGPATATKASR